jgi:hypothetical protein
MDSTATGRTKGLDGEILSFLHLRLVIGLHDRDGLVAVYPIRVYRVAVKVLYALHYCCSEDEVVKQDTSTYLGRYQSRQRPHRTPLSPESLLQFLPIAHQYRIPEECQRGKYTQANQLTLTPVSVASRTASNSFSYVGSQIMVNAESTIRPLTCTPKSTLSTSLCCRTAKQIISR